MLTCVKKAKAYLRKKIYNMNYKFLMRDIILMESHPDFVGSPGALYREIRFILPYSIVCAFLIIFSKTLLSHRTIPIVSAKSNAERVKYLFVSTTPTLQL